MSEFIIDAPLLACPEPSNLTSEQFQQLFVDFLSRLSDLSQLRSACKSIRFWRDEKLSSVLFEKNCFPFRHVLTQAFQCLHSPMDFQLEDINNVATALLEKSYRIEEFGDIQDIVLSDCSLVDDPVTRRDREFVDYLCRIVELSLPVLGNGDEFNKNTYIATAGSNLELTHITARYRVELIQNKDGSCSEPNLGKSAQLAIYRGAALLFREADLSTWWSKDSAHSFMDVCAAQAASEETDPWPMLQHVRSTLSFGSNFAVSARALGFMHDSPKIERLLRVCGDLMRGRNPAKCHALRTGKGPNEPQKTRGDWKAWRHDIDREFHLHYWRLGDQIELANVVVHGDFGISV